MNGTALQLLLLVIGLTIWVPTHGRKLYARWQRFKAWEAEQGDAVEQMHVSASPAATSAFVDATTLPRSTALANAPRDLAQSLAFMDRASPNGAYAIPLGWRLGKSGNPELIHAHLVDDVYHMLITAQSRIGKDVAASNILFALTNRYTPSQVQVCLIDGKGLDWAGWADKAHCWRLALDPEDVKPAMEALTSERRRRREVLQAAGVASWEELAAQGGEMPLLVVYVSELLLLENATSKSELTSWLNAELTAAGAFGIRYLIACQTASNFSTQWRSQISLFLAGYQPAPSQDAPNTGLTTAELGVIGATPPSELPGLPTRGAFTAVQGRIAATVRVSFVDAAQRRALLAAMPDRPAVAPPRQVQPATSIEQRRMLELLVTGQPLPIMEESRSAVVVAATGLSEGINSTSPVALQPLQPSPNLGVTPTFSTGAVALDDVPADEQRRIIEAAKQASSRRQVSLKLYEVTGGQKYQWVQKVCNAAGLLMPQQPQEKAA